MSASNQQLFIVINHLDFKRLLQLGTNSAVVLFNSVYYSIESQVLHLSSAHITISSARASGTQRPAGSILANSSVLDFLMPQLSAWQTKGHKLQQRLENIAPLYIARNRAIIGTREHLLLETKIMSVD
ncbi:MAG: hypothetical protein ACI8R9_002876 [Paraglaciecola sp.]